ncbi:MAG: response regulator [Deltaproteobacteria bacterium]|nr:response regulator [Deltaproteobacteria bacterium]MBW2394623.1 response regulator [Deltaproteobacteria bacterium]
MDETPLAFVVDDEPIVLRLVARIFERSGVDVHPVEDGTSAVAWLQAAHPTVDRALIDATVPPNGAAAIIEALRAHDPMAAIVMTSGKPLQADHRRLLDAVGAVYLAKPFGPQALLDAVEAARPA